MLLPLPIISSAAVCCVFFATTATKVDAFSATQSLASSRVGAGIISNDDASSTPQDIFEEFTKFLIEHQTDMISKIEQADGSENAFSRDGWGAFANDNDSSTEQQTKSGGITRVIQGGNVVEKGACSLTVIRNGVLTADRAATIQGRQQEQQQEGDLVVQAGDIYSAAALSVVLHTRNPFVPTFRSDVRIFLVKSSSDDSSSVAWFGGGSDLTPYYLIDEDISKFHKDLKQMCDSHFPENNEYNLSHAQMKQLCDEYFYLPARSEHRGTGGIFFDDLPATPATLSFVKEVATGWMPSWLPIVAKNGNKEFTEEQKHWQCLRRGRYLEFNLLYDRGVKFGLANANPRVEGVMVSAPPKIAFDYNHVPAKGSEEERLLEVLKEPKDWTALN